MTSDYDDDDADDFVRNSGLEQLAEYCMRSREATAWQDGRR